MANNTLIPVTIITGYLGAGKTTLLQHIIRGTNNANAIESNHLRLAIVMNEFGEIGIDGRVIEGENIKITELAGGCVCCSLSGEFELAMKELFETAKPEWIVIETTGAAEPGALAYDIKHNMPWARLDSIVTIVDADAMNRFPNLGQTGTEQIELADLILLNKTDILAKEDDGSALARVKERITKINLRAKIHDCVRCNVPIELFFGFGACIGICKIPMRTKFMKFCPEQTRPTRQKIGTNQQPTPHKIEVEYFDYVSVTNTLFDYDKFVDFLAKLPKAIYRSKGFVRTNKGDYLMNYVAGRHSLEQFTPCKRTELVFIGENATNAKQLVLKSLAECEL